MSFRIAQALFYILTGLTIYITYISVTTLRKSDVNHTKQIRQLEEQVKFLQEEINSKNRILLQAKNIIQTKHNEINDYKHLKGILQDLGK